MSPIKVAVIGGTGLDTPGIMHDKHEITVTTPFGAPSSPLIIGEIEGVECVLLSRHGLRHTIPPSKINYRANIRALKDQGVTHILATTACGSLQEQYKRGDLVVLDQFIDRTCKRESSFYSGCVDGCEGVCHVPMAHPFCERTRQVYINALKSLGYSYHAAGTVITIEGPRFSTKAESKWFRSMGGDVINMTTVPEVCLAREAAISYASLAMVTDYDCWKEDEESVSVDQVLQVLKGNASKARSVIVAAIRLIGLEDWSDVIEQNCEVVKTSTVSL